MKYRKNYVSFISYDFLQRHNYQDKKKRERFKTRGSGLSNWWHEAKIKIVENHEKQSACLIELDEHEINIRKCGLVYFGLFVQGQMLNLTMTMELLHLYENK